MPPIQGAFFCVFLATYTQQEGGPNQSPFLFTILFHLRGSYLWVPPPAAVAFLLGAMKRIMLKSRVKRE